MFKLLVVFILIFSTSLLSTEINQTLRNYISENPGQDVKIWIFFKDKGPEKDLPFYEVNEHLTERAIKRRGKIKGSLVIKITDYPVYPDYIEQLKAIPFKVRGKSRWLNAISVEVAGSEIGEIRQFDFVKEIRLMHTFKKRVEKVSEASFNKSTSSSFVTSLDYGLSEPQLRQIGAIAMHEKGFTGKGVLIAMLDDGFNRYNTHNVFDSLKVVDTYDFINNDSDVADVGSQPTEGWHGTLTLSVIAGNSPGNLIGTAFGASYLLAKTEMDVPEINIEEDHWVAGLEWAEAKGADVVNSSLGYLKFDDGEVDYSWDDLDGETAVTTKATIIAEENGLIVVNSAGNSGQGTTPNTLNAPADGRYVITVGGVDKQDDYWYKSSFGPTADGRIKPDVCAQGVGVRHASYFNDENFTIGSGTSFASPLVAGAIGLLVEAFPEITPAEVREAIHKTASQPNNPDNLLGYGVLNIEAAYNYILTDTLPKPISPNPFNSTTRIDYDVNGPSRVKLTIYDVLGRRVRSFPRKEIGTDDYERIDGLTLQASGIYFYHIDGKNLVNGKKINKSGKLVYLK